MANNTNALAGIFSGLGVAASSAASNSASNAYQKTLEINQALKVLDQERDLERQLKQDAVNDYNQEQEVQRDTNVKTKDFINNTLKTLEYEFKNNDFSPEELVAKKEIYINSINEKGYSGEQLVYANTGIEGINSMFRGEEKDIEIDNALDLLVKDGNKLDEKSIRQGNYLSTNTEDYYNLIDNSRNLQQNATRSDRAATATAIGNFMDDLSQREYVRGVLEKYDVSKFDPDNVKGTAFLQLDKTVGPAEAIAIQEVAELYRTNNIKDAFAAIKTIQADKNTDRANIGSSIGSGIKENEKFLKAIIDNQVTLVKEFDKKIPNSFEGDNIYQNNVSNFSMPEGISPERQQMAFLGAIVADLGELVDDFTMRKREDMLPETRKIAKIIEELGPVGKEYYLAGKLTKIENDGKSEFVWNSDQSEIGALYYKRFKGKTTRFDQLGSVKWDSDRILKSRKLLANNFTPEGIIKKTDSETYDVNFVSRLAFFQKYGAIFDAKIQNPYSREARALGKTKENLAKVPGLDKALKGIDNKALLTNKFYEFKENSPDMDTKYPLLSKKEKAQKYAERFVKFADENKLKTKDRDYILFLLRDELEGDK